MSTSDLCTHAHRTVPLHTHAYNTHKRNSSNARLADCRWLWYAGLCFPIFLPGVIKLHFLSSLQDDLGL